MFGAPGHRPQAQPQQQATKAAVSTIAAQLPEPLFVGRENELGALANQWAVSSPPSVVVGPARDGKRSVVLETVRRWEELREETQPESIALATELELTRSVNTEAFLGRLAKSAEQREMILYTRHWLPEEDGLDCGAHWAC